MVEKLTAEERLDLIRYIVSIVPDDLAQARLQMDDIADLCQEPEASQEDGKEE